MINRESHVDQAIFALQVRRITPAPNRHLGG